MEISTRGYHPKIDAMMRGMELRIQIKEYKQKKHANDQRSSWYWFGRDRLAFDALTALVDDWEAWYDDDTNIPEVSTSKVRALLIEKHVRELVPEYRPSTGKLYKDVFIWTDRYQYADSSVSVLDFDSDLIGFADVNAAERFIDLMDPRKILYGTYHK